MKNRDCNLVRDLLPNYVENLTNDDTNLFIENHLKDCSECSNILATMKDGENKNEENKSKKFINFSKKFRKKYKILKLLVLLVLFIIIFHTTRNCFIYLSIAKKHNESISSKTNYHYQLYSYSKDFVSLDDWYYKDGKYLVTQTTLNLATPALSSSIISYDGKDVYCYDLNKKYYTVISNPDKANLRRPDIVENSNKMEFSISILFSCALAKINSANVIGKDCYKIIEFFPSDSDDFLVVDKSNGMIIKTSSTNLGDEYDTFHYIDFDVVTDDDLKVKNSEDYTFKSQTDIIIENIDKAVEADDLNVVKSYLQHMINENLEIPSEYYEKYKYLLEE